MSAPRRPELELLKRREEILPPPLVPAFNETFVRSCLLYDEFIYSLATGVFREAGLEAVLEDPASTEQIVARAALHAERAPIPLDWILRELAARGAIERLGPPGGPGRFRLREPLPVSDPSEFETSQRALNPSWMVSYDIARVAALGYPDFLRGARTGEEVLFSPENLGLWFEYFSNRNGLYAINNLVGAHAAEDRLPAGGGLTILELGGGLGSAALTFLDRLDRGNRLPEVARYRFTEVSPAFLRRGQRALKERFGAAPFLAPGRLDMDRPFTDQDVAQGSVSMVYAVNTVHVARDLGFTLREIHRALRPGGVVVLSECIRPLPGQPIYAEFVFNLMGSFRSPLLDARHRTNGGFLTPEQWTGALEDAGFEGVRFVPDILAIRKEYPTFYVAAVGATRPA